MLRTTKNMKEKYEKIQTLLFTLIPEKWDSIYLYASVLGEKKNGEMYFYYMPKGILKKKPVNVYEVPDKFNINEEQYMNIVKELYDVIKELKQDFVDTEQKLWTSVSISIANFRFKVEYSYEDIPDDESSRNAIRVIWRYKYLKLGGEKKEERIILDNYYKHDIRIAKKKEIYETGLYMKTENNSVMFDKDEKIQKQTVIYEKEEFDEDKLETELSEVLKDEKNNKGKNQILNM